MNAGANRRVLHVIGGGGYGGREKMFHALLLEEHRMTDQHSAAFMLEAQGRLADDLRRSGITIHRIGSLPGVTWWYHGSVLFSHYDLIVCHTADWRLMLMCILSGRPVVFRLSGLYLLVKKSLRGIALGVVRRILGLERIPGGIGTGGSGVANRAAAGALPPLRSLRRLLRRWQFVLFLRCFCRRVIVNSEYAARNVRRKYHFPRRKKIDIIPNGIDVPNGTPTLPDMRPQLGIRTGQYVVGTVARFDVRKRIDRLLDAFVLVKGEEVFKLLIVGGGDDDLDAGFRRFVQEQGLEEQVIFAGFVSDVQPYMSAMDLFVLPSDNESFPNALMEAMLMGKPCVAFQGSGGPEELIDDRNTGFLVSTPQEIIQVAKTLMDDPTEAVDVGRRARTYIINHFSMERYAGQFRRVYDAVLGEDSLKRKKSQ